MITIVGVGIEKGDVTEKGKKAIRSAARVLSRVRVPMKTEIIGKKFAGADYESLDEFIAHEVIKAEEESGDAVYCALGDGYTDTAVAAIVKKRPDTVIIPGVSEYRGRRPHGEVAFIAACDVKSVRYFDTRLPLVVYGIDDALIAGEVKLALTDVYGDEHKAIFSSGETQTEIELYELDHRKSYKGAALYIAGEADFMKKSRYGFTDLMAVMARLTAPDGCPWDKAQTHKSIRINMIEEAYEAADAIDSGDVDNLREEIGDVLLQAVFHCDIAERTGEFTFSDAVWEKAKAKEKSYDTLSEQLDRLPESFPALLRAQKAYKKSVKAGLNLTREEIAAKLGDMLTAGVNEENAGEFLLYADFLSTAAGADGEAELGKSAAEFIKEMKRRDENGELKKDGNE